MNFAMLDTENKINNADISEKQETNSKVYELGYLLLPTIKEDDLGVNYGNLKELIVSLGGEIVSDEMPKMIPLAYTMSKIIANTRHKFNSAYFGWTKFAMSAPQLLELKNKLNLDLTLIRFLILKTVRENTIASKRFIRGDVYKRPVKKSSENEVSAPLDKAEIDKEIDALIAI